MCQLQENFLQLFNPLVWKDSHSLITFFKCCLQVPEPLDCLPNNLKPEGEMYTGLYHCLITSPEPYCGNILVYLPQRQTLTLCSHCLLPTSPNRICTLVLGAHAGIFSQSQNEGIYFSKARISAQTLECALSEAHSALQSAA